MNKLGIKTIIALLFFFSLISVSSSAQDSTMLRKHPPKKNFFDKVFVGGNLGLQFGVVTYAEVAPLVGYKFNEKISAGIGGIYQYYHYKDQYYDFETNVYGGRVFGRYNFTNYLFGHLEYEYLNLEAFDFFRRRVDVGSVMAGAGYIQHIGPNSGIVAMVLYNFTESAYTPYQNPIFRVGFMIGL
jgi:long-subunit fatty acid transport protein